MNNLFFKFPANFFIFVQNLPSLTQGAIFIYFYFSDADLIIYNNKTCYYSSLPKAKFNLLAYNTNYAL